MDIYRTIVRLCRVGRILGIGAKLYIFQTIGKVENVRTKLNNSVKINARKGLIKTTSVQKESPCNRRR
jgi:hypothetical protein